MAGHIAPCLWDNHIGMGPGCRHENPNLRGQPCCALVLAFSLTGLAWGQRSVSFRTHDGGLIDADLYGNGNRAVVLLHGGRFRRESWKKQASDLVAKGFLALSIDFRGEGQSQGGMQTHSSDDRRYLDVLGAIHYLRTNGASSVSVIGASMGGDYAAEAAEADPGAIDRLVLCLPQALTRHSSDSRVESFSLWLVTMRTWKGRDSLKFERSTKGQHNRKDWSSWMARPTRSFFLRQIKRIGRCAKF